MKHADLTALCTIAELMNLAVAQDRSCEHRRLPTSTAWEDDRATNRGACYDGLPASVTLTWLRPKPPLTLADMEDDELGRIDPYDTNRRSH